MASTRTRDWAAVDYYAVLGVEPNATDDDIARAFRTLAKQLHPDAGVPPELAERFNDISVAYHVLGDPRTRRDYDAVRAGVSPAVPRAFAPATVGGGAPRVPATVPREIGWTRRRAWTAFVGGLVVLALGVAVSLLVVGLQRRDDARRAGRVAVVATRVNDGRRALVEFRTTDGRQVSAPAPEQRNPGVRRETVEVLYDPTRPTDVIADENYAARDITLWIVAIKLLIGGPIVAAVGWRALQRQRRSTATPRWSDAEASPPAPSTAGVAEHAGWQRDQHEEQESDRRARRPHGGDATSVRRS